jgi:non-ribosomal peptide synthetase component F
LKELSRREGTTLFMTLLAAFQVMLGRYAGQEDVVVGTDVANRNRIQTEGLIGFFVNHLVVRVDLRGNPSFRDLLRQVRKVTLEAYEHQDVPFEKVVEEVAPKRDLSRMPLFQTKLVLHPPIKASSGLEKITVKEIPSTQHVAKLDLVMILRETGTMASGKALYNADLFRASSIRRIVRYFKSLLEQITTDADTPISNLALVDKKETARLTRGFSR